jgi:uncharacterized membrane protein YccC
MIGDFSWEPPTKCQIGKHLAVNVVACFASRLLFAFDTPAVRKAWEYPQAYDRITANLIGCAVGLALFPIPLPVWLELCLGIVLTIVIGSALKKTEALRSTLAAVVIVLLNERENRQWYLPLERVVCVVAGCVVALLVTLLFTLIARYRWSRRS